MPKLSDIAPGRFLSAEDLGNTSEVVVIDYIEDTEVFNASANKKEIKTAAFFVDREKAVIVGAERRDDLIAIFGDVEWDALAGKKVELYTNKERGKLCIRFRAPGSTPAKPAAPAQPSPVLNPAQAKFRATLKTLYPNATADEQKAAMVKAGRACLGKDYADWNGDDWRDLTPVQLGLVENQLREDAIDGSGQPADLDGIPF